jgi:cytochrome P450
MSKNKDQKTIFHDLIYESKLPPKETTVARLRDEGTGIVAAGTVTTGRTLYLLTYFVLKNPDILSRLQEELKVPFADYPSRSPTWKDLEKLPYLTAVLQEALRLSYGAVHRLARVFPDYAYQYEEWVIPPNVCGHTLWNIAHLLTYFRHQSASRRVTCMRMKASSPAHRSLILNAG